MLRSLYDKVSSTIDAQSVARNMFQSNALTLKELQSIQCKHSEPVIAAEQLLNIVLNQSDNVYSCFLNALKETSHREVFEVIVSGSYKGRLLMTDRPPVVICDILYRYSCISYIFRLLVLVSVLKLTSSLCT